MLLPDSRSSNHMHVNNGLPANHLCPATWGRQQHMISFYFHKSILTSHHWVKPILSPTQILLWTMRRRITAQPSHTYKLKRPHQNWTAQASYRHPQSLSSQTAPILKQILWPESVCIHPISFILPQLYSIKHSFTSTMSNEIRTFLWALHNT